MKRTLVFIVTAFCMIGVSEGMEKVQLSNVTAQHIANFLKVPQESIDEAKHMAARYVAENCKNSSTQSIVKGINEAGCLRDWVKHGKKGSYQDYSKTLAELLLKKIKKNSKDAQQLKEVLKRIADGFKYDKTTASADSFVLLGIDRTLLSTIGIW